MKKTMKELHLSEVLQLMDLKLKKLGYKGYDPYDFLNSSVTQAIPTKTLKYLGTQVLKRFPIRIRPLLGIRKGYVPKGIALILHAKCRASINNVGKVSQRELDQLFDILLSVRAPEFKDYAWGLNYPYATKSKYVEAYRPSLVVTDFVCESLWQYYQVSRRQDVLEVILSAGHFVMNELPRTDTKYGVSTSYYIEEADCVINANAHAAEMYARHFKITGDSKYLERAEESIDLVLRSQQEEGYWNYRVFRDGKEREQIDFHQGNILDSLLNYRSYLSQPDERLDEALRLGAEWYRKKQFSKDGATFYRYPAKWPKDIHHQAQGVYTFAHLTEFNPEYLEDSLRCVSWALDHLYDGKGGFYYRKNKWYTDKQLFIRWGQAWMYLALTELSIKLKERQET